MPKLTGAFAKFNKKNLKFGSEFRPGTKGLYNKRYGLRGALNRLIDPRFGAGRNLSKKDIDKFEKILSNKLKSKYRYSKGLNRYDRYELRLKLQKLWRDGEITKPDLKDFYKIIELLSE
jgi:hypothetical protein